MDFIIFARWRVFFSTFNLALSHRYCFTLIIQITVVVYPLVSALSLASGEQQKTGVNNSNTNTVTARLSFLKPWFSKLQSSKSHIFFFRNLASNIPYALIGHFLVFFFLPQLKTSRLLIFKQTRPIPRVKKQIRYRRTSLYPFIEVATTFYFYFSADSAA